VESDDEKVLAKRVGSWREEVEEKRKLPCVFSCTAQLDAMEAWILDKWFRGDLLVAWRAAEKARDAVIILIFLD
jgi:hypothetical protein